MSMQDTVNEMLTDVITMAATTTEITAHIDKIIEDPTPLTHEQEVVLLTALKKQILMLQSSVNESADVLAHAVGLLNLDSE